MFREDVPCAAGCNSAFSLAGRFGETATSFSYAPRLRKTATLRDWCFGVEDLTDTSNGTFFHCPVKAALESARSGEIAGMNFEPCINERPDQPAPNCALVIRGVP